MSDETKQVPTPEPEVKETLTLQSITSADDLPATWGLVNGKSFNAPLPDGKPIVIPDRWKLPIELRGGVVKKDEEE